MEMIGGRKKDEYNFLSETDLKIESMSNIDGANTDIIASAKDCLEYGDNDSDTTGTKLPTIKIRIHEDTQDDEEAGTSTKFATNLRNTSTKNMSSTVPQRKRDAVFNTFIDDNSQGPGSMLNDSMEEKFETKRNTLDGANSIKNGSLGFKP